MNISKFQNFTVYNEDDQYCFITLDIDENTFCVSIFNYFFSEDNLLTYSNNQKGVHFTPTKLNYAVLYKLLAKFFDQDEIVEINKDDYTPGEVKILNNEFVTEDNEKSIKVHLDKIGKIGEYILSTLLREYFKFDCVIPKLMLITNYNMSIYGIDCIHYSSEDNLLLFGESKISKTITNGIALINKSLSNYEKSINDELALIIGNNILKKNLPDEIELLAEESISFNEFITKAKVTKIGIPLFIGHGELSDPSLINNKLKTITKQKFFNLDTCYYIISLPFKDKGTFINNLIKLIKDKCELYE